MARLLWRNSLGSVLEKQLERKKGEKRLKKGCQDSSPVTQDLTLGVLSQRANTMSNAPSR